MDWTVRPASAVDAERLALVGGATFLETFAGVLDGRAIVDHCRREHSHAAYEAYLGAGGQAWLAETCHGSAPVGFSLVGETHLPGCTPDGSDIELKRIYTLSRFHGTGMGAELMKQAILHAEQRGYRRILLGVYAGNARARAFYARQDFIQIADRKFRVGEREYDDVVLARQLRTE
ncbi:GNAT family N-acetyltransferase [Altericroceibacterium xinjiangense]|uniref:GNAT family N-acetyltransferase n=1 Tax=Altericroceibacterium xinjiangense TaxID=762261 RepID=UPI000F7F1379|nr:GNAT family N-acetyltransferase [Altericroceibacterium xinjiangense]